jgi:hypothetical protein
VADQQQNDDSNPLTDTELERLKMYQDTFKHMTTFCSGGILLASAVTGALFLPKPDFVPLLALSIFLLAVGALFAMLGLNSVTRHIDSAIDGSTESPLDLHHGLRLSVWLAYVGLLIFATFAMANLVPGSLPIIGN